MFGCHSWRLVTVDFVNIPISRHGVMQVVFVNECKSCKTSKQMFFNAIFLFLKIKDELVVTYKSSKIKLFSVSILHGASNEPEAYLEPSQTSMKEHFCKTR